jgi:hypothetical protein
MKKILLLCLFCVCLVKIYAQKQTFDLATFTSPKGWKKQLREDAMQLVREDTAKGTYCLIILYKTVKGTTASLENFNLAWRSLVKEAVTVSGEPEMQTAETQDGWETQSGYAPFEREGEKGIVLLSTATESDKMMNMLVLTNTNEYEKELSDFLGSIRLKKPAIEIIKLPGEQIEKEPAKKSVVTSEFQFTTTNFDDGWTSTVQEDWVEVRKGDIKVLLHYPNNKINPVNTDLDVVCTAAWNALVAPRYSNMENYQLTPGVVEYERPYFAQANLTDKQIGKKVFVALFKKGNSGWIEIITTDRSSFLENFGLDIGKIDTYADSKIWEPLQKLRSYNKFAVAASDFKGKWSSSYTGTLQYVNIYTGNSAGMNTHSSSEAFEFTGNNYAWELKVASGFVGNIKFQGVKSNGKFTVPNNWQVHFSEIEKKERTYNAYFSCVKGARLLWLQDTGYGDYRSFGKVE